jgi:transcriptional regulator with XRE-family HTH domain
MAKKIPNPADKQVGNRLRMRRLELGMSQTKLGDSVGLTFQQIQKYEKGANRIGASRVQQFANILGVTASYFFEDSASTFSSSKTKAANTSIAHVSEFVASSEGKTLMKAFGKINSAGLKRAIVHFVEQLAGPDEP